VKDHGAKVLLGARNAERGEAAVKAVKEHAGSDSAPVELVLMDVGSDESVQSAAASLTAKGIKLDAIVNNAGRGFMHEAKPSEIVNVNLMGPKRVVESFLPLLSGDDPRIVNVGSGAGPLYVREQARDLQKILCSPEVTWEQIEKIRDTGLPADGQGGYGLSKSLLMCYTMSCVKTYPNVSHFCVTPGFIDTAMTAGFGASKKPEEGTVSIRHALFEAKKEQSGWFFGSDGQRSPLHFMRNPGEPAFDGVYPWE